MYILLLWQYILTKVKSTFGCDLRKYSGLPVSKKKIALSNNSLLISFCKGEKIASSIPAGKNQLFNTKLSDYS